MAIEARRGCGYRKVGGLYLVGSGISVHCDRLPYLLHVCPTCSQGIKPSLGFTWIDSKEFLKEECKGNGDCHGFKCKICNPESGNRTGLMWVGSAFYTPNKFIEEANTMGVSKRVGHVPRGLEVGDFVMLAHKNAGMAPDEKGVMKPAPAIFYGFHVTRIEKVITESQSKDVKEMERLKNKNITPFIVPDNDKDHQGTVYDKEEKQNE